MIQHATREATIKKVEGQYEKIPRDLLQKGIEALAASPEAYLFIRNQVFFYSFFFQFAFVLLALSSLHAH